ncbi:MAG TPA: fumarylacetoacetate hydrolase family protein [Microthrixaceae bacterium]|nr:fumarylacetoacetate hydrolase family protein [Microthrixaceae bacterium]
MKVARIELDGIERLARVEGDLAFPLRSDEHPGLAILLSQPVSPGGAQGGAGSEGATEAPVTLDSVKLLPPIARPGSVIAIGLNYADHASESGLDAPAAPVTFAKLPQSVIGHGEVIRWSTDQSTEVDYEAELAVIIGAEARSVPVETALDFVLGYTCCNDVSARDAQFGDGQWLRGKSFDTFCPIGPWLVTPEDIPDPQNLRIACRVNGQALQDSNTSQMIFSVAEIISYLSGFITLLPGDVITTGTPAGVGFARTPPIYLHDGDTVEIDIEGIGVLANTCGAR